MNISQREARRLRKQVKAQADKIRDFEWAARRLRAGGSVEGVEIYELKEARGSLAWALQTAQRLGHIVIARQSGDVVKFRAMPLPSEEVKP